MGLDEPEGEGLDEPVTSLTREQDVSGRAARSFAESHGGDLRPRGERRGVLVVLSRLMHGDAHRPALEDAPRMRPGRGPVAGPRPSVARPRCRRVAPRRPRRDLPVRWAQQRQPPLRIRASPCVFEQRPIDGAVPDPSLEPSRLAVCCRFSPRAAGISGDSCSKSRSARSVQGHRASPGTHQSACSGR
jgi:hypothetical protein